MQRAADAAALAGAPYLPADPATAAVLARSALKNNGIEDEAEIAGIEQSGKNPALLQVRLKTNVDNYFIGILDVGLRHTTLGISSTGIYPGAMPMGSPSNVLGSEPVGFPSWRNTGNVTAGSWLTITGGGESKLDGDQWDGDCSNPLGEPNGSSIYGCSGGTNTDALPFQSYTLHIPEGSSGTLQIQAFDAPYVDLADPNTDNCTGSNLGGAVGLQNAGDPSNLYATGTSSPYCTNDCTAHRDPQRQLTSRLSNLTTPRKSLAVRTILPDTWAIFRH